MPNDFMTLNLLVKELSDKLSGGRINKINMPSEDEVYIDLRAAGKNQTLVFCARKPAARVHLTSMRCISPATPSAFCMLMRKHLIGGVIEGFYLYNNDRIAVCEISSKNELHDLMQYKIILEIGGTPNFILAKQDFTILDCTRRIFDDNSRSVIPSLVYSPPIQNAPNLFITDTQTLTNIKTAKDILTNFVGVSRETAAEIEYLISIKPAAEIINELLHLYDTDKFSPCLLKDKDGKDKGFFSFPYSTIRDGSFIKTDSLSEAADAYYSQTSAGNDKSQASKALNQTLKKLKAKTEKRLKDNANRLLDCEGMDRLLQLGELIKCYAHNIAGGQAAVTLYDFYNDNEIAIQLNPLLSPMKNAEAYFRKYSKLKGAKAYAIKEKAELNELLDYLLNIEQSLSNCTAEAEFLEIGEELNALAGNRGSQQKNTKKLKPSLPIRTELGGFTVYIGKNNAQNDNITFKIASGRDLWLHAKGYHGSHGIIITNGKEVPISVISKVASFVAFMSKAASSSKVEVDYTRRANVKRLGKPGLVTYTDYKTVTIEPQKPIF